MTMEDLKDIVHSDPETMGGTPVFVGTRVPLQNLIDALEGGESIEDFLEGFPSVTGSQAKAVEMSWGIAGAGGLISAVIPSPARDYECAADKHCWIPYRQPMPGRNVPGGSRRRAGDGCSQNCDL